jgi:hypothetical protein
MLQEVPSGHEHVCLSDGVYWDTQVGVSPTFQSRSFPRDQRRQMATCITQGAEPMKKVPANTTLVKRVSSVLTSHFTAGVC